MAWLRSLTLATLTILAGPGAATAEESEVVLIAHPGVEVHQLSRDTARALFAMRQRTWPDGQAARVFVLTDDHPVHVRFAKELLAVYPHQLQLAWNRQVFSGTGQAPILVRSLREMHARIATTPGALGYLEREQLDEQIQVISMD